MVVLMHSPMPSNSAPGLFLSTLSYLTAPCIGLFFMVSGALLLPVRSGLFSFLKKRFGKIIFPTLFWTAVYIAVNLYFSQSEVDLVRTLCSLPFSPQGHGVLWFMYTLAGLYLLAPIISGWLLNTSKREVEFVLALWTVTLCYPVIGLFADVSQGEQGILYYFTGYAGYFLLGYYMTRWPEGLKWKLLMPLLFIALCTPIAVKIMGWQTDFYEMFWYLSIFVVILTVNIFKAITQFNGNLRTSFLAKYTFGIYLCHILIMRHLLWKMPLIDGIASYPLQTIVVMILTFGLSLLLCMVIGRLPYAGYIIGTSSHKKS